LDPETNNKTKIEKIADHTWSVSSGQLWPVFIKRFHPTRPVNSAALKQLAVSVKRYADNRLCVGPNGYLDVFFNDRNSLELFSEEMDGHLPPPQSPAQVKISYCSGLLFCPMAAVDTITATDKLSEILTGHSWVKSPKRRLPLTMTIAGCQVGQGLGCGLYEYSDINLIGLRDSFPKIDQKIASLSPNISLLITDCPGKAINRSHITGSIIEINHQRCTRCGWCVNESPAFTWPTPQKGYFSLELSGRRTYPPYEYIPSKVLWPKISDDWMNVGLKLMELIEFWRAEAVDGEILADFVERRGLKNLDQNNLKTTKNKDS
jgi:dissimilatory sulfite reductase (desulfoviridin) alpha/beta subunit